LNLYPEFENLLQVGELALPFYDLGLERTNMSLSCYSGKNELIFIQAFQDIIDFIHAKYTVLLPLLPGLEVEYFIIPVSAQFIQFLFDIDLLISGITDILNVFLELQDICV